MTPDKKPTVTIVHRLPGRVRARLSQGPRDSERLKAAILEHDGLESIDYTPVTRSVLVRFNPHAISEEEIVLRIALHLSLDYHGAPVRLLAQPERLVLADTAIFSAIAVGSSLAMRSLGVTRTSPSRLDWIAGIGTVLAVIDHAWKELDERGYFDPEVLSLAYLLTGFLRRDFLKASVVTWLTTFGRHLLELPPTGVQVRPLELQTGGNGEPRYELVIAPDTDAPERVRILSALQGMVKYAMTGGGAHGYRNLWEELRDVSKVHGEVLEGFGRMRHGIPMRFD
jgi:hypothetical protein